MNRDKTKMKQQRITEKQMHLIHLCTIYYSSMVSIKPLYFPSR